MVNQLMSTHIEKKQAKSDDEESEYPKIGEILSYISEETKQIKCQGNTFNRNYDMVGFLEYWQMYLKLLENQNRNCTQIRLKKISALIKIAQYQNYIGAIKKPQEILSEAYKLMFDSDLSANHIQSPQNQQIILKMDQEDYSLYTLVVSEAVQVWINEGLFSKCIRTLDAYLKYNQSMQKNPPFLIVQKLILLHLQADCFSKAPALYKRYVCGRQIKIEKKDSMTLLTRVMTSILENNENKAQGVATAFQKVLEMEKQIIGYNDLNYLKMLSFLKHYIFLERNKLSEKQELVFQSYFNQTNNENISNQNFILLSIEFLNLGIKTQSNEHLRMLERGTKLLGRIQEKLGKFNYYYLDLKKALIAHSILEGNIQQTEKQLVEGLQILINQSEIFSRCFWEYLQQLFQFFLLTKRYKTLYQITKKVIKLQEEVAETQSCQYLDWLYRQITALTQQNRFLQAIPIIQNIQAVYKSILGQRSNHHHYVQFLQKVGGIFLRNNYVNKAQDYFYSSLEICENSFHQTHQLRISAQQKMGELYKHKKQYHKSAKFYEICLSKMQKGFYFHSIQYILRLIQMADCYFQIGEVKLGLRYIKKCISLQQKLSSFKQYYEYDSFKLKMLIYERMNRLKQAIKISEKCLKFQIKFLQARWKPSLITTSLTNLCLLKERQGLLLSSSEIFKQLMKSQLLQELSRTEKINLLQKLNSFQHFYKMTTNLNKTAKVFQNIIKQLSQLRNLQAKAKQIIGFYRKLALTYQQAGSLQNSIQVTEMLRQVKFQFYQQRNSSKFLTFLILNKPQLIWKGKIRLILLKQFKQTEGNLSKDALLINGCHLQMQVNQRKATHISKLIKLMRRMGNKLSKKYENSTMSQLNIFRKSLFQKRRKKLINNLMRSKKAMRTSEFITFLCL